MFGIDLSNHQKGIDIKKKMFGFAIVKATEGVTFVDPSFKDHIRALNAQNKLIGCYHFARPDRQNTIEKMEKSADHFVKTVESVGMLGKAILVIDWEHNPICRIDLIEAWANRVYETTGITPFIYANSSFITQYKKEIYNLALPIWVARWKNMDVIREWPDDIYIEANHPGTILWNIWQFSSTGAWPGFNGRVDLNYTPMSQTQWKEFAFGKVTAEEMCEDMKWAIENGLFKGFPDGTYRENQPVTRGQLATVLRRFFELTVF